MSEENQIETPVEETPAPTPAAKNYPTDADENGCYFESADEEEDSIVTKKYPNGRIVKIYVLYNGKVCVTRKLKGKDGEIAYEMAGIKEKDSDEKVSKKYAPAVAAMATKIDGVQLAVEELRELDMDDYSRVLKVSNSINFSSGGKKLPLPPSTTE